MARYRIDIEYDGTKYCGWQRQNIEQENSERGSIQAAIEHALFQYCGENITLTVAGRTDAGVHAIHQVAHFDMHKIPKKGDIELTYALNAYLQKANKTIAILETTTIDENFSARFDAKKRQYLYKIILRKAPLALDKYRAWQIPYELNIKAMREAANFLYGKHDFSSFRSSQCQAKNPIRTLDSIDFSLNNNNLNILIAAPSFLHNQVRIMVGSLYNVGRNYWDPNYIKTILELKDRTQAGPNAPPHGLYLYKIFY